MTEAKTPRAWFWPTRQLTYPRRLVDFGQDEHGRYTIGLRVPGGIWWIAWRTCRHRNQMFDRSVCPDPCGYMHTDCTDCGARLDPCAWETQ